MAQKDGKDWRVPIGDKLPLEYSQGGPADEFVCIAPKGCYHLFRFFGFGDTSIRRDLTTENITVPRHFAPKTKELMLKVNELKRKKSLPQLTLRGQEV